VIDHLDLFPVRIETPTLIYERHRLVARDGTAKILGQGRVVLEEQQIADLNRVGHRQWLAALDGGGEWQIASASGRGCQCRKGIKVKA
jgi:hypothetical protein